MPPATRRRTTSSHHERSVLAECPREAAPIRQVVELVREETLARVGHAGGDMECQAIRISDHERNVAEIDEASQRISETRQDRFGYMVGARNEPAQ